MAQAIREAHRLLTVRIGLKPSRSGAQLRFDSYHGDEHLERREVAADAVGIQPDLSVRAYRSANFELPGDVTGAMSGSLQALAQPDEPMWLQVGSSAGHLAVVPWERLLQPALDAPLLRIPNFLADPVFHTGVLRIALCVSSPRAKTPFDVPIYTQNLLGALWAAVPSGTDVHVFADLDAYGPLNAQLDAPAGQQVTVHDPNDAASYGEGEVDTALRASDGRVRSPWLRWIKGALREHAIDAMHFVCPGYFRRDQGALALARSPAENLDRDWSHFVSADELITFLDRIGAWSVGFSPPFDNVWSIGLRLLADRLAWQRPGPLLLHDTQNGSPDDLHDSFRFLYGDDHASPPRSPNLMLYSHPRRIERYGADAESQIQFDTADPVQRGGDVISDKIRRLTFKHRPPTPREPAPAPAPAEPVWKQSSRRLMDQMLIKAEGQDDKTREGMMDALGKFKDLLEEDA